MRGSDAPGVARRGGVESGYPRALTDYSSDPKGLAMVYELPGRK